MIVLKTLVLIKMYCVQFSFSILLKWPQQSTIIAFVLQSLYNLVCCTQILIQVAIPSAFIA